jgi:GxxExxY protein
LEESLLFADETFRIRAAVFEVHKTLGSGFLEAVYQESLALEFAGSGIPFAALRQIPLNYKGISLTQRYTADFVCFEKVIVEIKAVRELAPEHRAQTMNYLKATGMRLGLLINFGGPSAKIERFAL